MLTWYEHPATDYPTGDEREQDGGFQSGNRLLSQCDRIPAANCRVISCTGQEAGIPLRTRHVLYWLCGSGDGEQHDCIVGWTGNASVRLWRLGPSSYRIDGPDRTQT